MVFDIPDIAQMLGVSKSTIMNLTQSGKLGSFRVGTRWKIQESDLMAYLGDDRAKELIAQWKSRREVTESNGNQHID